MADKMSTMNHENKTKTCRKRRKEEELNNLENWKKNYYYSIVDWEMEEVESFLSSVHRKKIRPGIEDKLLMKGSNHINFSVRTLYSGLDFLPEFDFPFRSVWNHVIPSKISFFAWEAS